MVAVKSIFGKKIGSASTNSLSPQKIKEAVKWAETIAALQKDNPDFVSLARVKARDYKKVKTFVAGTSRISAGERAKAVIEIIEVAKKYSLTSYGSVSNGSGAVAIGNSLGTFAYSQASDIYCNVVMAGRNSTGYAQHGTRDIRDMDFGRLAETAARKAISSADPVDIAPGKYTTIFEPLAVNDIIGYLASYAFNGRMFLEGRSFLAGKMGKPVVNKRVTILDDPVGVRGFAFPFDMDGVPKKKLVLIDKGIAKNVVYDSITASKAGKRSTGHSIGFPNPWGPIPLHLTLKGGRTSLADMIKSTKKGVLVTRLHYTNVIDPHKIIFTGMTRDGTFLIEDGKITRGVKNLRFTENLFEALNRIDDVSKDPLLVADEPGYGARFAHGAIVPAVKIRDFTFTSATEF
jgi:predicted Zn-dependent protease